MKGSRIKAYLVAIGLSITILLPTMGASAEGTTAATPCSTPPTNQVQSPIIIEPAFTTLPATKQVSFYYPAYSPVVENTGGEIEISENQNDPLSGGKVTVNHVDYFLEQFHFHSNAEHHLKVQNLTAIEYPLEIHFVHKEAKDPTNPNKVRGVVVVAVFIKAGQSSGELAEIFNNLPTVPHTSYLLDDVINLNLLIPSGAYYHYNGSLTTPDYCEGVNWYVFKNPITLTAAHIQNLKAIYPNNDRAPKSRNNRVIYRGVK
ncbi:carbonic anhydrase family protein [Paenibacillus sp. SC116]|uniref:carbonic anhydrase family protein n=1 Tax=Paenibacillus sp. SC116 TaxID=2968986 RepID=UPI00215A3ACD|nr:carbonic anhydrase family protein [Paenibacillus sp. SC116]MCR8843698.1 carbonic anhydrase family protein [Paenibacillus sp. SC116]